MCVRGVRGSLSPSDLADMSKIASSHSPSKRSDERRDPSCKSAGEGRGVGAEDRAPRGHRARDPSLNVEGTSKYRPLFETVATIPGAIVSRRRVPLFSSSEPVPPGPAWPGAPLRPGPLRPSMDELVKPRCGSLVARSSSSHHRGGMGVRPAKGWSGSKYAARRPQRAIPGCGSALLREVIVKRRPVTPTPIPQGQRLLPALSPSHRSAPRAQSRPWPRATAKRWSRSATPRRLGRRPAVRRRAGHAAVSPGPACDLRSSAVTEPAAASSPAPGDAPAAEIASSAGSWSV